MTAVKLDRLVATILEHVAIDSPTGYEQEVGGELAKRRWVNRTANVDEFSHDVEVACAHRRLTENTEHDLASVFQRRPGEDAGWRRPQRAGIEVDSVEHLVAPRYLPLVDVDRVR